MQGSETKPPTDVVEWLARHLSLPLAYFTFTALVLIAVGSPVTQMVVNFTGDYGILTAVVFLPVTYTDSEMRSFIAHLIMLIGGLVATRYLVSEHWMSMTGGKKANYIYVIPAFFSFLVILSITFTVMVRYQAYRP